MPPLPAYGQSTDYEDFYSSSFSRPQADTDARIFGPNLGTIAPGREYFTDLPSLKDLSFNIQQIILLAAVLAVFYAAHLVLGDYFQAIGSRSRFAIAVGVVLVAAFVFYALR
jgi:hypothetical protein